VIEECQIVLHKAHQPHLVADLLDADVLAGEDRTQIDLAAPDANPAAASDRDGAVMKGVFEIA
jgi:hypothetical protein